MERAGSSVVTSKRPLPGESGNEPLESGGERVHHPTEPVGQPAERVYFSTEPMGSRTQPVAKTNEPVDAGSELGRRETEPVDLSTCSLRRRPAAVLERFAAAA
jgi:hypothetical protein